MENNKNKSQFFFQMHASIMLAVLNKKRARFALIYFNFIAVQVFTRLLSSPPAGTPRFAESPLRGLALSYPERSEGEYSNKIMYIPGSKFISL